MTVTSIRMQEEEFHRRVLEPLADRIVEELINRWLWRWISNGLLLKMDHDMMCWGPGPCEHELHREWE